jgi:hypothetical protein
VSQRAVATSPDGTLLAAVYTQEDGDMREEPELFVWDLRPMVRDLLWHARRNFLIFLVGHKFLPVHQGQHQNSEPETPLSVFDVSLQPAQEAVCGPLACCKVFHNTALVKAITAYIS